MGFLCCMCIVGLLKTIYSRVFLDSVPVEASKSDTSDMRPVNLGMHCDALCDVQLRSLV